MLLQKAKDPAFWEKVRTTAVYQPLIQALQKVWEEHCTKELAACKFTDYILFHVTGNRDRYERPYFSRRMALSAAAILSMIYPEETKYFDKLCDVIWAILDEYDWCLPAHCASFSVNDDRVIDLFSAETGCALAEIDYLLSDRLPPLIRGRIDALIDRRIMHLYETRNFWWERCENNWAAVCMGSVAIAYIYKHPERFEAIRPRMEETLRCFLAGFPEDGVCLEGLAYWDYGFGFYVFLADMVLQFTDGKINYFDHPKIPQIVKFPGRMFLDGGTTVSFSDSGMKGRWPLGVVHYLKNMFPHQVQMLPDAYRYTTHHTGRWPAYLRAFLWLEETLEAAPAETGEYTDYAPDSAWLIKKTKRYSFAAKGGHNGEPHNHNDLGHFIVTRNGRQVLCDPGAGTYSKQYFSKERYQFFHTCSRGHSVPIVNGQYQKAGREHRAAADYADGVFTLEFANAYGIPELTKLTRQFSPEEDGLTLRDTFAFWTDALPVTERFVSCLAPEMTDGGVAIGGLLLKADGTVSVSREEGFWCIDYALNPGQSEFVLRISVQE